MKKKNILMLCALSSICLCISNPIFSGKKTITNESAWEITVSNKVALHTRLSKLPKWFNSDGLVKLIPVNLCANTGQASVMKNQKSFTFDHDIGDVVKQTKKCITKFGIHACITGKCKVKKFAFVAKNVSSKTTEVAALISEQKGNLRIVKGDETSATGFKVEAM